ACEANASFSSTTSSSVSEAQPQPRPEPAPFRLRLAHHHHGRRAVIDSRRVPRRHRAVLAERGAKLRELLDGHVAARMLVLHDRAGAARRRDGHDLLAEAPLVDRPLGALLALRREPVLLITRNAVA